MVKKNIEEITVYESTDGGKTIYCRSSRDSERKLIYQDPQLDWRTRWYNWRDIIQAAENNTALDDVIKKAEMVYDLIKEPRS